MADVFNAQLERVSHPCHLCFGADTRQICVCVCDLALASATHK